MMHILELIIQNGTDASETLRPFEGFGTDGGYISSASDHFFETPVENLKAFAAAAKNCTY